MAMADGAGPLRVLLDAIDESEKVMKEAPGRSDHVQQLHAAGRVPVPSPRIGKARGRLE